MKKSFLILVAVVLFVQIVPAQSKITIKNSSSIPRNQLVSIPFSSIKQQYPAVDTNALQIIDITTKQQIPYQFEYLGKAEIQNILIAVNTKPKSTITLQLTKGKKPTFTPKTYARYVPERKDDFAWESDKIAFRMYGKALELTPKEMAYGVDVWVKRTDRLIINERYLRNEYHIDHGDGMDYYHVGLTLGAGGNAPIINDSIYFSKNYISYKVLDNGPLRSSFQLNYAPWHVAGQQVEVTKVISIDVGSQLSKVEATYTYTTPTLPIAIGIIRRPKPGQEWFNQQDGIMAYWEPTDPKNGTTGVASIVMEPIEETLLNKQHLLSIVSSTSNKPITYYTGAAWDRAGEITNAQQWFNYLTNFKIQIDQPLVIGFK